MSELAAFEAFREHTSSCGACRPKSGLACELGLRLHDAWRRAAEAEERERKQRELAQQPARRRSAGRVGGAGRGSGVTSPASSTRLYPFRFAGEAGKEA
ncbi:MAG: hypothetical protein ACHQ0J_05120 [Candidatus Dormibacterales bacterium]